MRDEDKEHWQRLTIFIFISYSFVLFYFPFPLQTESLFVVHFVFTDCHVIQHGIKIYEWWEEDDCDCDYAFFRKTDWKETAPAGNNEGLLILFNFRNSVGIDGRKETWGWFGAIRIKDYADTTQPPHLKLHCFYSIEFVICAPREKTLIKACMDEWQIPEDGTKLISLG